MWNDISNKMKQWIAVVKQWVILKKDWVILGIAGVLAVALVVGVALAIVDKTSGNDPVQNTTTGIQMEATEQTQQTTGEEADAPSATDETTVPATTDETTMPDETDPTTESTGTEPTNPTQNDSGQEGSGSSGTGFTDQAPQDPITPVTPSTPTTPEATEPDPTETMAPEKPVQEYTYSEYMDLSKSEKVAFFYKFPSLVDFNRWYNAAKKAYDDEKLIIGDSSIDLGELIKP